MPAILAVTDKLSVVHLAQHVSLTVVPPYPPVTSKTNLEVLLIW